MLPYRDWFETRRVWTNLSERQLVALDGILRRYWKNKENFTSRKERSRWHGSALVPLESAFPLPLPPTAARAASKLD